jgi:hypothetical protein
MAVMISATAGIRVPWSFTFVVEDKDVPD